MGQDGEKQADSTAVAAPTEGSVGPSNVKTTVPPTVITVDTAAKEGEPSGTPLKASGDVASQARTPKHANKNPDESKVKEEDPGQQGTGEAGSRGGPPNQFQGNYSSQPRNFEGRVGGSGAFQPHDRHGYQQSSRGLPPMQVSPGSGRYYPSYGAPQNRYGPPPSFQRGGFGGQQHPQMYPPQPFQGGYEGSGPSWGPPPSFPHGRPPTYPPGGHGGQMHPQGEFARGHPSDSAGGNNTFSRAVSSSFDRSIKSRDEKPRSMDLSPNLGPSHHNDAGSVSGDASWGQLNQVTSVDEDEMRKRLAKGHETPDGSKEVAVTRSASNSSSLTNSPTDGVDAKKHQSKLQSSLDSLSSVASAQAPIAMDAKKAAQGRKVYSPNEASAASLDLMKCESESSALLLPAHQRDDSQFSFGHDNMTAGKRDHVEEREDIDTNDAGETELRKAPSIDEVGRPKKKGRVEKDAKKSSPLSIECSPPTSPSGAKRNADPKLKHPQPMYGHEPTSLDSFYDKAPSYTYSIDSAPPMPRDPHLQNQPSLRPGSSSSSITPMTMDIPTSRSGANELRQQPPVGQIPSWEIQPQDSFGAASVHANGGLMSSFSFTQDYPMLSNSASAEHGPPPGMASHHHHHHHGGPMESRNQSFEGGHYHGGFTRTDSMMSYEGHHGPGGMPPFDSRSCGPGINGPGYHGPFPPHASSWGSASSFPQGHPPYGQYQNYPPPVMRNYSEDSGMRTSPPPGSGPMRSGFQSHPEYRAPSGMVNKSGMSGQAIMSSPYSGKGAYGWTKEEDMRLTDIMKKYKNPRDWEPIAKEHSFGRSAKECHERWIRYLKPGVRKGQWTDHEDAIVMDVVTSSSEQPFTRWSDLAQRLPGRVGKQIRDRWVNHLNPNINHLPFSREDDLLLWEGHKKLGKRWVEISTKFFNSSRSENHIKNRWYSASFKKFITNEFGAEAYSGGKSKSTPKKKKDKGTASPSKRPAVDSSKVEAV